MRFDGKNKKKKRGKKKKEKVKSKKEKRKRKTEKKKSVLDDDLYIVLSRFLFFLIIREDSFAIPAIQDSCILELQARFFARGRKKDSCLNFKNS